MADAPTVARRALTLLPWALSVLVLASVPVLWAPRPLPPGPFVGPESFLVGRVPDPPARPPPGTGPNLVVVVASTLRRDMLSVYGADAQTPTVARLAEGGVVFDDLVSTAPTTLSAAVGLLVGNHAVSVGMTNPTASEALLRLPGSVPTLGERMWALGYETIGVAATDDLSSRHGWARGFDLWEERELSRTDAKDDGGVSVRRALGLVGRRSHPRRPLYLQVQLADTQPPRGANPADIERLGGDAAGRKVAVYRFEVERFDRALSMLVAGLAERDVDLQSTVLTVVGDHGEGLRIYDKHRGHGRTLYASVMEVPWLIRGAGVASGHRVSGLASGVDFLPTMLGLIGHPDPTLPGRDWSPLVRGEGGATDRAEAFTATWYKDVQRAGVWTHTRACLLELAPTPGDRELFVPGCFSRDSDRGFEHPLPLGPAQSRILKWVGEMNRRAEALSR